MCRGGGGGLGAGGRFIESITHIYMISLEYIKQYY